MCLPRYHVVVCGLTCQSEEFGWVLADRKVPAQFGVLASKWATTDTVLCSNFPRCKPKVDKFYGEFFD